VPAGPATSPGPTQIDTVGQGLDDAPRPMRRLPSLGSLQINAAEEANMEKFLN